MDVLGSASFVLQNEALTQNRLATDVNALATGLRVRSAADDPSGYTIAQTIQTKAAGLQQSVTNVQTANNLLNVADGALSNIQLLLQRVRSLTVEANSDINSSSDLENLQAEINQLLLEVNRISSSTNFNGLVLFNGQFQVGTGAAPSNPALIVTTEPPPFGSPVTGQVGSNTLVNGEPFIQVTSQALGIQQYIPAFTVFTIVSVNNNMVDPDSQSDIGPGVLIQQVSYSTVTGGVGPAPLYVDYTAIPLNTQFTDVNVSTNGSQPVLAVNIGAISASDVGAQFAVLTQIPNQPVNGHALNVNDGGDEGQTISIDLPELSTNTLDISDITVLAPNVTTVAPITLTPLVSTQSSANVSASYAEIKVDAAIEQISTLRAQVGAQLVATQQDANNDDQAIVSETASVSNIRDADIGATVTDFTKQQILVSVGNSVLSQLNVSATQLTALLLNSFAGAVIPGG